MLRTPSPRPLAMLGLALILVVPPALDGGWALAQPDGASVPEVSTPKPVSGEGGGTTVSFGDWVLRCQRGGGEVFRVCEVAQSIQLEGQAATPQIAIARLAADEPLQVTVILPPNVALTGSVRVLTKEETPSLALTWRHCLPGGCVAAAVVHEEVLQRWRGAGEPGRITFRNAGGQEVAIPLSFRGLAGALDALSREPI